MNDPDLNCSITSLRSSDCQNSGEEYYLNKSQYCYIFDSMYELYNSDIIFHSFNIALLKIIKN